MQDILSSSLMIFEEGVSVHVEDERKCLEEFKKFKAFIETQLEHKIKLFRSDNGG